MNENYKTAQESFWAGEFGDAYADRNQGQHWVAANLAFFSKVLTRTSDIGSIIEFGANIGLNLMALKQLLPKAKLSAIEINQKAVDGLNSLGYVSVHPQSILDFVPSQPHDLTLIKGVLIHINPDMLPQVYELLYQSSARYICVAEYYNPSPVTIPYRGESDRLFKRDFAGEMLDRYGDLKLLDYGFSYHRDNNFPQDDLTWFLLEKTRT
ncbi:MAG: pseudaminic acid biosynthesis-associated methylase [Sulfuricella denitrificans]|nr:pseudaminic acid biosynthesis-associated methylase [Sulfuricella denitrificans]